MPKARSGARRGRRSAVAAVELAICLPVIVVVVFAAIEACDMIFTKQALHASSYEGARVAIQASSTSAQTIQRAEDVLAGHSIEGATVTCQPADLSAVPAGSNITVTVSVDCEANRNSLRFFFAGRDLEASTTMVKEG